MVVPRPSRTCYLIDINTVFRWPIIAQLTSGMLRPARESFPQALWFARALPSLGILALTAPCRRLDERCGLLAANRSDPRPLNPAARHGSGEPDVASRQLGHRRLRCQDARLLPLDVLPPPPPIRSVGRAAACRYAYRRPGPSTPPARPTPPQVCRRSGRDASRYAFTRWCWRGGRRHVWQCQPRRDGGCHS